MCSPSWNKLIALSSALAAGGVLTCAAVLLDVLVPRMSLVGFLTRMLLLGFVVTGIVIGYAWVCDKCESCFNETRSDRPPNNSKPDRDGAADPGAPASSPATGPKAARGTRRPPGAPQLSSRGQHVSMLCGSISAMNATKETAACTWPRH